MKFSVRLTSAIRRLLRLDSPTVGSAIVRLNKYHNIYASRGLEIKRLISRDGAVRAIQATHKAAPERSHTLSPKELFEVRRRGEEIKYFMQAFLGKAPLYWTLKDLDEAFRLWQQSVTRGRFSPPLVVAITGAAFGEYCNQHLGTRWVWVIDHVGKDAAIRSADNLLTSFPYSTVRKRIDDSEYGFFESVFCEMEKRIKEPH